jgi:predicted HTH transcriptional regulator
MRPEDHDQIFRGESPHVERKSSHRDQSEILQAVCAFANDLEGVHRSSFVVVGVRDQGTPTGEYDDPEIADKAQQKLSSMLSSTQIVPHPSCPIHQLTHQGTPSLSSRSRPSRFRRSSRSTVPPGSVKVR